MVARSAYVQLRHSPVLLLLTTLGLALVFVRAAGGRAVRPRRGALAAGWRPGLIMAATFLPTLRRFGLSPAVGAGAAGHRRVLHGGDDRLGGRPPSRPRRGVEAPRLCGDGGMSDARDGCRSLVRQGPRRREFPGRLGADQRRGCARISTPSTPSPAMPTTSPTARCSAPPTRSRGWTRWRTCCSAAATPAARARCACARAWPKPG